jgi:hypothetical protein
VSEYQYYEFQAVDRPLTDKQMAALRNYSSRAQITPSSFVNVYNYGSFKGDEDRWMEEYFDAFLHLANWGSRRFKLRLPKKLLDQQVAAPYCSGGSLSYRQKDEYAILSFSSEDEDPEWVEGEGWLAGLVQIRSGLMRGDHRALYLGWLLAVQSEEIDTDMLEPPVPPGLGNLDAPLARLADFLRVGDDLIAAAAEHSLDEQSTDLSREDIVAWLRNISTEEKDLLLSRLIDGADLHLAAELRQRAMRDMRDVDRPAPGPRRTAGDILARSQILADERRKKEAAHRAAEEARHKREQAEKRRKHLESLAGKESSLWAKVDEHIAAKLPKRYDEAVALLRDLHDLAAMKGESADFSQRIRALYNEHTRKPSLVERLRNAKLLG